MWDNIKSLIGSSAPIVASLIGGPVAGSVAKMVAVALDCPPEPSKIEQAIKNDPDALLKLAHMERQSEIELQQLAMEEAKAYLADMQHAREQHKDHWMPPVLTMVLMIFLGVAIYIMANHAIPVENRDIMNVLIGNLVGFVGASVAFWLGNQIPKKR